MDYEKKYKEALENARKEYNTTKNVERKQWLEELFPELESEDEKIRKEIIALVKSQKEQQCHRDGAIYDRMIAWLERQGEQKSDTDFSELRTWKYIVDAVWTEKEGIGQYLDSPFTEEVAKKLQKRFGNIEQNLANSAKTCKDEQKPTDKVEPKFHEGDWVVQEGIGVYKVIEVCESWYEVIDFEDIHYSISFDKEYMCHLWTIEDAKNGDVLVDDDINVIGIFDGIEGLCWHSKFYYGNITKQLYGMKCGGSHIKEFAKPATKEQRDLLFSKMREEGYEWDAEKKELKKM